MNKIWLTEVNAICPKTDKLKTFAGQNVMAESQDEAEKYCESNGLGYLKIIGVIDIDEIEPTSKMNFNSIILN